MRDTLKVVFMLMLLICIYPLAALVVPVWAAVFLACDLYDKLWPPQK